MRNDKLYPHIGLRTEEDWQRFAESIVKECLDILDDEDVGGYEGHSVRIAAHMIKEHFEIE